MRRAADRAAARALALAATVLCASPAPSAAEVLLAEMVQAGDFVFYRDSADEHAYHYAPTGLRLAEGADGHPQFLFVKYTRASAEPSAEGQGGLLHALMTWGLDARELSRARAALTREDPDARLLGPVPITSGEIAVVSAAASAEGELVREIVGTGTCSILPGSKCALGMALSPEGATVLWETFQKPTSDVSAVFHVEFKGLTPAFDAHLEVHWDRVYSHRDVKAGITGGYKWLKGRASVHAVLDDLRESGALELRVDGSDQDMETLWETVYGHLIRLMFTPTVGAAGKVPPAPQSKRAAAVGARPGTFSGRFAAVAPAVLFAAALEEPPEESSKEKKDEKEEGGSAIRRGGVGDKSGSAKGGVQEKPKTSGDARAGKPEQGESKDGKDTKDKKTEEGGSTSGEGAGDDEDDGDQGDKSVELPKALEVSVDYVYRRERRSGTYEVDFRKRLREERRLMLTENLSGFLRSAEDVSRHLVEVDLDDPFFQDRPVDVLLDQASYRDLRHYVNAVSVQMRHRHDDGAATEKSVVFTPEDFEAEGNRRRLLYPRLGDRSESWLAYSYKVDWHFFGGALAEGEWRETSQPVLSLSPPAEYRTLRINADQDDLTEHNVVAVSIQLRHRLFGEPVLHEVLIEPDRGDPLSIEVRYLHEPADRSYEVRILWTTRDGGEVAEPWTERQGSYVPLRFPDAPTRAS